ncbi:MAG: SIR2 family protein [Chloroflexi bacterium]|nr:SIR2 family protein [Chloroflexota bacterium]
MNIPTNLLAEFGKGHGVVFVGAGLSKGAGLPDWKALMRPLADELKCSPDLDPTKIAQYYQNTHGLSGRNLLVQHVKRMLNKPGTAPTRNHALLAKISAPIIFTTNFDDLLERALADAKRDVQRIIRDKNVGYWDTDKTNLVKMHGSLDDEEMLIITADDYAAYFRAHANITRALSALLMTHTFLFVGYSLSDPDLWQIYNQIRFDLAEHKRPAYAIFLNGDPLERDNLQRGGIIPINLTVPPGGDYNATLGEFLEVFLKHLPAPAPKIAVTPAPPTPVEHLAARVEKLLGATGFETLTRVDHPLHQIDLVVCADRGGARETRWLVACRAGEIEIADVRALAREMMQVRAARAYLVSEARVAPAVREEARATDDRVRALTLDAFYRERADFTVYAQHLVQEWAHTPQSQYYVDLGGRRQQRDLDGKPVGDGDPYKPIDEYLDAWLDIPGGNHISVLGDYGTGKTTLVKQYAAKLARKYLANPEKSRIPILISLREYAKAMNLRQLITDYLSGFTTS